MSFIARVHSHNCLRDRAPLTLTHKAMTLTAAHNAADRVISSSLCRVVVSLFIF